jgi:hypothetical protein
MTTRNYSNVATPTSLTSAASAGDTVLNVASTAGYPSTPFTIGLERGTVNEEFCLCTAKSPTTLTVTRGYDGTTAVAHNSGASVEHAVGAIDYDESNDHINITGLDHHTQYLNTTRHDALDHTTVLDTAGVFELPGLVLGEESYYQASSADETWDASGATQLLVGLLNPVTFTVPSSGRVLVNFWAWLLPYPSAGPSQTRIVLLDGFTQIPQTSTRMNNNTEGAKLLYQSEVSGLTPAASETWSIAGIGDGTNGGRIRYGGVYGWTRLWVEAL